MAKNLRYDNNNITSQCKTIYNTGKTNASGMIVTEPWRHSIHFHIDLCRFFRVALLESARDQKETKSRKVHAKRGR